MASIPKPLFRNFHPISFCILLLALLVGLSPSIVYADGEIDTSFGTNGLVSTSFGQSADGIETLALDGSGNIVAGGYSFYPDESNFALARYMPDGELDTSFGTNGLVSADLHGSYDLIEALILDLDGNIIVGGSAFEPQREDSEFALARYKPNGELDITFGTDGLVFTDFDNSDNDSVYSLVIDSQGNIVAGGHFYNDSTDLMNFALARYKPNGELDPTFGTDGQVANSFGGMPSILGSIALDNDGNIVAGGYCYSTETKQYDFIVARYTEDGELDTTFGTNGWVTADFCGGQDFLECLILDGNGNIVAGGYSNNAQTEEDDFVIARYTANGELDTSFGTNGLVSTDFGRNDKISSLAIDSYGKIVAGGSSYNANGTEEVFAVARYTVNGELDTTFGTNGLTSPDFAGQSSISSLAINGDGNILAGGFYFNGEELNFAMTRLKGTPPALTPTAFSGSSGWCNITALPGTMILLALPLSLLYRNSGK